MQASQHGGSVPPPPRSTSGYAWVWWVIGVSVILVLLACGVGGLFAHKLARSAGAPGRHPRPAPPVPAAGLLVDRRAIPVPCTAVVADGRRGVIYATAGDELVTLDLDGRVSARTGLAERGAMSPSPHMMYSTLRLLNADTDPEPEVMGFDHWGHSVDVFNADGTPCWQYLAPSGVDDAWAGDIDGDGKDEVVVGLNGSSGLPVLDDNGALLWKDAGLGNTWSVCMGDVNRDGKTEVVAGPSTIRVYDGTGKLLNDSRAAGFVSLVRPISTPGCPVTLVGGGGQLFGLGPDLKPRWSGSTGIDHSSSSAVAESAPWLALADVEGRLVVLDAASGSVIASREAEGVIEGLSWYDDGSGKPRLVVAAGDYLAVLRFEPRLTDVK